MHRSITIAFLGVALIIAGMVTADAGPNSGTFKIGFVDFDRVLTETAAGKRASKQFEKELKSRQGKLDKQQQELQEYAKQLEKQKTILKPDVLRKRQQELQKRYVELQQTYVQLERELSDKRGKLIGEILKRAKPAIKAIASEGGYDMIVDRAAIVWSDTSYDLTEKIKQRIK